MALFAIFGGLPFFWQDISFPMLLGSRFLFGIGCGCINPLVQAVITNMFQSETMRSFWIGIINVIFSIGASVGSLITGVLALNGWQSAYAFYLFAIVPLALVLIFFKDSEIATRKPDQEDQAASAQAGQTEKRRIPANAWLYIVIFMFCTLITQVFFSYAGVAMGMSGINTALIGTVFMIFTVAGIAVAALNAAAWKFLRLWNLPLSYALLAVGYVICIVAFNTSSIALFFTAAIVIGVGCCLCGMVLPMIMSVTVPASALTLAIGFQEVARNLGSFLSSPWLQMVGGVLGDTPVPQFTAICVLGVIVTVVAAIVAAKDNKKFKNVEMKK
jgi:MFS family permease